MPCLRLVAESISSKSVSSKSTVPGDAVVPPPLIDLARAALLSLLALTFMVEAAELARLPISPTGTRAATAFIIFSLFFSEIPRC
jgi:hypothetical protein